MVETEWLSYGSLNNMKRVLVDFKGTPQHICDIGDEFEVYEGADAAVRWVNCNDDNVTMRWHLENGEWLQDIEAPPSYAVLRSQAYGTTGDQLDMIYRDMLNGTSHWVEHVTAVKEIVPGPNSEEARMVTASRPRIDWGTLKSPAWTDKDNNPVPGVLHLLGLKDTVVEDLTDPNANPYAHLNNDNP